MGIENADTHLPFHGRCSRVLQVDEYDAGRLPCWGGGIMIESLRLGGMAERSKAPVLKTGVGQPTGGSNPSPSARELMIDES